MSTTTINAKAIDTTNTNDDVVTKLELERYQVEDNPYTFLSTIPKYQHLSPTNQGTRK